MNHPENEFQGERQAIESEQIIWETLGWKTLEEKEKWGKGDAGRNPGFVILR